MSRAFWAVGEAVRDFDGVSMRRLCRGCDAEFYGASGYCRACQALGERMDECFYDREEREPLLTVKAPSRWADRMWPLHLLIVLGGIAYLESACLVWIINWLRAR